MSVGGAEHAGNRTIAGAVRAAFGMATVAAGCVAAWGTTHAPAARAAEVTIESRDDRVRILVDGDLFTEYLHGGRAKPVLHPLVGPRGRRVTRAWPLEEGVAGEAHDHPHHESLWFTHGMVNGIDFWAKAKGRWPSDPAAEPIPRIVQRALAATAAGGRASIDATNDWVGPDGAIVCTERRRFVFSADATARVVDVEITIAADHGSVTLGDTKEGTMAIRVATPLQPKEANGSAGAAGRIVNSEGLENGAAWGKPARWVDYSGPIGGAVVGIAMLDHPANIRHPTHWHARDYGLFAANPFGLHDFTGAARGSGDHTIPAGESLTLRYRIVIHDGDAAAAGIEDRWRAWSRDGG